MSSLGQHTILLRRCSCRWQR